jgi:hypothetical protein
MDRSAVSRDKLQKVYATMYAPTRARLKAIAALEGISLLDLMDTVLVDYIRGWERVHRVALDKRLGTPSEHQTARAATTKRKRRRRLKQG